MTKNIFLIVLCGIVLSCTNKAKIQKRSDLFSLDKVDVAIIYSEKLNNFPCLLYNITDTIKNHYKAGIVFTFDVKFNYNHTRGSGCGCAIEPGLGGPDHKIKNLKVLLKNDKKEIDITKMLFNKEESLLLNSIENFDKKRRFDKNDFSCVCFDEKKNQYLEYLNKDYLGGRVIRKVNPKRVPILKSIEDFMLWFNNFKNDEFEVGFSNKNISSGNSFSFTNFSFWLPDGFYTVLKNYDLIKIEVELDNGLVLEKSRELIMK